jgi:hypothetical protein
MNTTVLYGPVPSRRYGLTLGVGFFDGPCKVCTFRCPYCQLKVGAVSDPQTIISIGQLQEAFSALDHFFTGQKIPDAIVVSGNGEPTLYPEFRTAINLLQAAVAKLPSQPPVVVLTNGTRLGEPEIAAALSCVDEIAVKLDPNPAKANRAVEPYDPMCVARKARAFSNLTVQACFYEGQLELPTDLAFWIDAVVLAKPLRVDLYTLSRQTVAQGLKPVSERFLRGVAIQLGGFYKGPIRIFA